MGFLTRMGEILLLVVKQLGRRAYGIAIRSRVEEWVDKTYSVGASYSPLDRLTWQNLLETHSGEPIPQGAGRPQEILQSNE